MKCLRVNGRPDDMVLGIRRVCNERRDGENPTKTADWTEEGSTTMLRVEARLL